MGSVKLSWEIRSPELRRHYLYVLLLKIKQKKEKKKKQLLHTKHPELTLERPNAVTSSHSVISSAPQTVSSGGDRKICPHLTGLVWLRCSVSRTSLLKGPARRFEKHLVEIFFSQCCLEPLWSAVTGLQMYCLIWNQGRSSLHSWVVAVTSAGHTWQQCAEKKKNRQKRTFFRLESDNTRWTLSANAWFSNISNTAQLIVNMYAVFVMKYLIFRILQY